MMQMKHSLRRFGMLLARSHYSPSTSPQENPTSGKTIPKGSPFLGKPPLYQIEGNRPNGKS